MLLIVVAGLLFRAWHFRRAFRAELIHARLTGAPEPVYRNPFLGGRWDLNPPDRAEVMEVPTLWDEEMCLEPTVPYTTYPEKSKLGTGAMDEVGGWGKGKAVVRPTSDGSERTLWEEQQEAKGEGEWGLEKVQPASLHRFGYGHMPKLGRVPTTQPPFSHEMRDALLAFVPRKHRDGGEEVEVEQPRIGDCELKVGEEVGVGVLIVMPRPEEGKRASWGGGEGLEGAGEVSLGVLECRAT